MRYQVRWNNGYWKLFDKHHYTDVALFGLRKDCQQAVDHMNIQNHLKAV